MCQLRSNNGIPRYELLKSSWINDKTMVPYWQSMLACCIAKAWRVECFDCGSRGI